jgi:uncharacterized membrane protein YfcA
VALARLAEGFLAGLAVATVTTPAGISGAVFLLPVQLNVLHVPNPAVTPTNLLYNVVAGPGALFRFGLRRLRGHRLTGRLLAGTVPGVIAGAAARVYLVPGPRAFRLVVATVLLPLGVWILIETLRPRGRSVRPLGRATTIALGVGVGVVGGVYGIGGGSILGPILVASGLSVVEVAPAALASTFLTSLAGSVTFAVISLNHAGSIAPDWAVGLSCGLGGLVGGYAGARVQPRVPENGLRLLLGLLALCLAVAYLASVLLT